MSYYLHDLAPFLFRYTDGQGEVFAARWDGLAYLVGFALVLLLLKRFASRGYLQLAQAEVFDFTSLVALLGVLLGGRLGYLVLYDWERFSGNLGLLFQLSQGGTSFHGGLLGVAVVTGFLARKHHLSWLHLGDNLVTVAPLGLFLGRLSHFMDGDLFGRVTQVPWAVRFPAEIHLGSFQPAQATRLATERLPVSSFDIMQVAHSVPQVMDELLLILNPRHPSQLYEAALEGLLLFIILYTVRTRARQPPEGMLCGLFFLLHAVFHIGVGFLREFRNGDPMWLGLSQGQLLSLPMIAVGLVLLGWSLSRRSVRTVMPCVDASG
ncbi:prolipoprotein diacylglyceryl transferase [Stigmatella sp. ncwal1]|uniref:Phosphatidylglycerol--prolipoprotein diacylglyceryl transferase n=1 Tax=Stigmatella ashevillensis TaxID=2995309 RepID=A0ABT5DFD3_9BACT|nr:prolipoprotein diacylglyceryl transferase [Stigmatella ashevillena]MDC0712375.1 prolipoprotein diacylglyceryl transferase [Stigmatella ashevillena]